MENKELESSVLDLEKLQEDLKKGLLTYNEANNQIDMNGLKTDLSVAISQNTENLDQINVYVSGYIPVPVGNGDPIVVRLDRKSTMSKDDFMGIVSEGLKAKIQDTVLHGQSMTQEEIAKRDSAKAFSMFTNIGSKFDKVLETAGGAVVKGVKKVGNTLELAADTFQRTKVGKATFRVAEFTSNAVSKGKEATKEIVQEVNKTVKETGKAVKDSFEKANAAYKTAKTEQRKINSDISVAETKIESSEKQLSQLRGEINTLNEKLIEEMLKAENNGASITNEEKQQIDILKEIIKDKMAECVQLRETIEESQKNLTELRPDGAKNVSPREAARAAMRKSYFEDISKVYDVTKQSLMAEYEAGKQSLKGMAQTFAKANEKYKTYGYLKSMYAGTARQVINIGKTGFAVMHAMEVKTADYLRERAVSLSEKYQHRAEVRSAAKNLWDTIRNKEDIANQPSLTERELSNLKDIIELADKFELRADKAATRVEELLKDGAEKRSQIEKAYKDAGIERPLIEKENKSWEPRTVNEEQKKKANKIKEDVGIDK